ncbi:hypothetical protein CM240_3272 [Clostridium bornimense]|uniref:Uncharacterized protein n=1 Tax=Clostridium bornimense TaxID=1216932 RepID=W6S3B8_9CLOT|nr:hypothetical protein [Clostridium bornimense]CDM70389.1 hypothetical protein CM240_3272 [Clostridium bornimense]
MDVLNNKNVLTQVQRDFIDYRDTVNYKTMAIILYIEKLKDNKDVLGELKNIKTLRDFEYRLIELCLNS